MRRANTLHISAILDRLYDADPEVKQKIMNMRIIRAWEDVLGHAAVQSTRNLYVKNGVLHVSVTSSVLRNELWLNRERLKKLLNESAGGEVIHDLVIR